MDSVACEAVDVTLPSLSPWKLNSTFYLHGQAWGFQEGSAFPWAEVEDQKRAGLFHEAFEKHLAHAEWSQEGTFKVPSCGSLYQTFVLS